MSDHHGAGSHEGHHVNSVSPEWARRILWAFYAGCIILVALDLFVIHRHTDHPWEEIPVFYALYGFIGISALIVISKGLRRVVMRSEDYYDAE